jgi:hypothetical protein
MKTTMKKLAAYLLALLLVIQMVPAFADPYYSHVITNQSEYRDMLEITSSTDRIPVGHTITLETPEGYDKLTWESDYPDIASVENGVVTANAPGTVKIWASQKEEDNSVIKASIVLKVFGESAPADNSQSGSNQEETQPEKIVIVIKGAKDKIEYDGAEHTYSGYTVEPESEASNITLLHPEKIAVTGKDCKAYPVELSEDDFQYTGEARAQLIVSGGFLQIKPAGITIKTDDKQMFEGREEPEYTITVTGLAEGDTIDFSEMEYSTLPSDQGILIVPDIDKGAIIGNYKVKEIKYGKLTVIGPKPLYNIAKIGNTYYRLAKTSIWTAKDPVKDKNGNLNASDYTVDGYDFSDLTITVDGKEYVYNSKANSAAIINGANYYEVNKNATVSIVKKKIGALDGNKNPRWLVPENQRYDDPNETDSIHRDFTIVLHENTIKVEDYPIYTMLSVDGSNDYYKLPTTTIRAKALDQIKNGVVNEGEYILERYDFSGTVVTIDGVEYKYNDGSLDEYENYFTVTFFDVEKVDWFNRNDSWFKKRESWLDGAFEAYGTLPNKTTALHANYKATTHKAEERIRSVTISSDWPKGVLAYTGARITLTATLDGFSDNVTLQWERSTNGTDWEPIAGETGITYTYILDDSTAPYVWRVVAED